MNGLSMNQYLDHILTKLVMNLAKHGLKLTKLSVNSGMNYFFKLAILYELDEA